MEGLYLGEWFVAATAGGDQIGVTHTGSILSSAEIVSVTGTDIETNDVLDNITDPSRINYSLQIYGDGEDTFHFVQASGAQTCFVPSSSAIPVYVGPDKEVIASQFSLDTLGSCMSISIDDVTASESDANASFTVSLNSVSTDTVTVNYVTQSDTATADVDYTETSVPVTVSFAPGETSKVIDIPLIQDSNFEIDEKFTVELVSSTNATIIDSVGHATILDDEIGPCGAPGYDKATEKALFVWKDCQTGEWFVRNTGGGDPAGAFFDGEVFTNQGFVNVSGYDLEGSDTMDNSTDISVIDFYLKVWNNGEDGFDFTPVADAGTCLDLFGPAGVPVLVGPTKLPVTGPFDLSTLGACTNIPVDITIDDVTASEADSVASFTVTLSAASASTITVDYVTQSGTAMDDVDYTAIATPMTLTFNPGVTSLPVDVVLIQDTEIEGDESFQVVLSNATNSSIINASGQGTIDDDELGACGAPVFDKATEKALFVWKDCQTGEWFVRNTGGGDPAGAFFDGEVFTSQSFINVTGYDLESSDTVDNTTDPVVIDFYLKVWNNGEDGFQFTPAADAGTCLDLFGPAGIPVLVGPTKLAIAGAFDLGTLGACTNVPVDITIDDVTANEANTSASFTVSLSAPSTDTITVDYVTQSGTATDDVDYTAIATPATLTFNPGITSLSVDIALLQDTDMEGDESFTVILSNASYATIIDATGQAIIKDDEIGACGIPSYNKATEKALFVWKDCQTGEWTVRITGGGDPAGVFYDGEVITTQGIVNLTSYELEGSDTLDNTTDPLIIDYYLKVWNNGEEGFQFTPTADAGSCLELFGPAGIPVLVGPTKLQITGAFDLGTLGACTSIPSDISINDIAVNEADATASFTVTLNEASTSTVTVDYVTLAGTAADDVDFTAVTTPTTVTFNPGITSMPVDIAILQDSEFELDESFTVTLSNATNGNLLDSTGEAIISDDDIGPCGTPVFDKATEKALFLWKDCLTGEWSVRMTGGGDPANTDFIGEIYSDQLIGGVTGFSLEGNDTLDNTTNPTRIDYLLKVAGTGQDGFLFTPTSDTSTCFEFQTTGVPVYIGETRIAASGAFDLGTLAACTNVSTDIMIDDVEVSEADATASFTVSLSAASSEIITVNYTTQSVTASDNLDFTAVTTPATLTFNPGTTSLPVDIAILQDTEFEVSEEFTVNLTAATNGTLADDIGIGTIADDDIGPCGAPVYDKSTEKALFIWKDCQTGAWFVRTTGGGDPTNTDFIGEVFSDQNITNVTGFSLEGNDMLDNTSDPLRIDYLMKVAGTGQDGFEFVPTTDTGTCFDSKSIGIPVMVGSTRIPMSGPFDLGTLSSCLSLDVQNVQVNESDAFATFTVTLSAISASTVTVDYITAGDSSTSGSTTATDGLDYTQMTGSLTFNPGETSKTIDVPILQDGYAEGSESFAFNLSNAVNSALGASTGIGVITDDEVDPCGAPSFNPGSDQGVYLWRDCGSENWHMVATAGGSGSQVLYQGDITSDQPILNLTLNSIEINDVIDSNTDPLIVDFTMKMKTTGSDGIDFNTTAGVNTCFTVLPNSAGGGNVFVGSGKTVVAAPFELSTMGACN